MKAVDLDQFLDRLMSEVIDIAETQSFDQIAIAGDVAGSNHAAIRDIFAAMLEDAPPVEMNTFEGAFNGFDLSGKDDTRSARVLWRR